MLRVVKGTAMPRQFDPAESVNYLNWCYNRVSDQSYIDQVKQGFKTMKMHKKYRKPYKHMRNMASYTARSRIGPRWPQDPPQNSPKLAQDGSKMTQDDPKMAPRWCQAGPRWPKIGPTWPQDGPKTAQEGPYLSQDSGQSEEDEGGAQQARKYRK